MEAPVRKKAFASDNASGIHPRILEAIAKANDGNHYPGYGNDPYTKRAVETFKKVFGSNISVHFVWSGTSANVLSIGSLLKPYQSILTAETAHLHFDETGAPEKHLGVKVIPLAAPDGKITPGQLLPFIPDGDFHHAQPRVVSITQCTEYGAVYSIDELKAITDFAHRHSMLVHMDGARLSNAAASLGVSLKAVTADVGIDFLSFGGTKNGLMGAEAIVFFDSTVATDFKFYQKQGMQCASKMRFLAAQLEALIEGDLWLRNAFHANKMAALLYEAVRKIPSIKLTQVCQANSVWCVLPKKIVEYMQEEFYFYVWSEQTMECRLMTTFDTQEADVHSFVARLHKGLELFGK